MTSELFTAPAVAAIFSLPTSRPALNMTPAMGTGDARE
jgi:hypothetical protein